MFASLLAGALIGVALLICLLAWGDKAFGGGSSRFLFAFATILTILSLIVIAHL